MAKDLFSVWIHNKLPGFAEPISILAGESSETHHRLTRAGRRDARDSPSGPDCRDHRDARRVFSRGSSGRRRGAGAAALHGGGRGGVRGADRRPQPGAPRRRRRARDRRVRTRPRRARHARRVPLPRHHRRPLPWRGVREPDPQVCRAGVRRGRGGSSGRGSAHQEDDDGKPIPRKVRNQVLRGRSGGHSCH